MKVLPINNNFLSIGSEYSSYESSAIVINPIPYEMTTSYGKGARNGPRAILEASAYVEFYDDETERELCFEKGIATIEPLVFDGLDIPESLSLIRENVSQLLKDEKFVVSLGGEHSITLPIVETFFSKYPDLYLLQFDAHSDLRQIYEDTPYSHACVISRICEFLPAEKVTQVGIRALSKEEALFIKDRKINVFFASKINEGYYGSDWHSKVVETLGKNVYITLDVDFFDPSVIPATGTPEPNGFYYSDLVTIIKGLIKQNKNIIGFDVTELSPIDNFHHPNLTIARIVYKLLNLIFHR
ncbi:MAG: agmatinase [Ignavibacteria bacterium]|nr:agmatinase [Ignavibacteria bacterium]